MCMEQLWGKTCRDQWAKLGKVNILCEKLGVFKLFLWACAVCLCTGMCSYLNPTDNPTLLPPESRAVLRAGWLLCLFCGFGYFFPCWLPAICSSRNVVAFQSQFQITDMPVPAPSKPLPGREAAGSSPNLYCCFSSSRCCSASCGCRGRDADPERGKVMWEQEWLVGERQCCLTSALRRQKSILFEEKVEFGDCGFEGTGLFKRSKRIWRVSWGAVRGRVDALCKLLGRQGGRREVKEWGGYRKLCRIQKIRGILGPHFQLFARSSSSYYKT